MSGKASSALFRSEFLDKDLLDFAECEQHYKAMSHAQLLKELKFLFRPDVTAIPFGFAGKRYYAFLASLIDCAANARSLSSRERAELIANIIAVREYGRGRTEESGRAAFDTAVAAHLDEVAIYGLFPTVAELIRADVRDYGGTFEEGVIGQILERKVPAEEVPRLLFNDSPHCAAAIQAYIRVNGDPFVIEDYGAYLFRQAGGVLGDGTIDVAVLDRWEAQYRGALSMLPGLQSKLDEARAAQVNLEKVKAESKARRQSFELSPAMLFVNNDPMMATEKLFELPDTTAAMHDLLERMDGNQEAIDGLRNAVVDYVRDKIGVTNDRAAEYLAFMEGHQQALAVLFDETRMKTFRNIGAALLRCLPPASVPVPEIRERLPTTTPRRSWRSLFGR